MLSNSYEFVFFFRSLRVPFASRIGPPIRCLRPELTNYFVFPNEVYLGFTKQSGQYVHIYCVSFSQTIARCQRFDLIRIFDNSARSSSSESQATAIVTT